MTANSLELPSVRASAHSGSSSGSEKPSVSSRSTGVGAVISRGRSKRGRSAISQSLTFSIPAGVKRRSLFLVCTVACPFSLTCSLTPISGPLALGHTPERSLDLQPHAALVEERGGDQIGRAHV